MKKKIILTGVILILILVIVVLVLQIFKLNSELQKKDEYNNETSTENKLKDISKSSTDIDTAGGLVITLEADETSFPEEKTYMTEKDIESVIDILSDRLDFSGYPNKRIHHNGAGQITVEIPGETMTDSITELLGSVGLLEFKNASGEVVLTGNDIQDATYQYGQLSETADAESYVELTLKPDAVEKWSTATENAVGSYISIYIDGLEISRPFVSSRIVSDKCVITGGFTVDSAKALANQIKSGALPFGLKVIYINQVSPQVQ